MLPEVPLNRTSITVRRRGVSLKLEIAQFGREIKEIGHGLAGLILGILQNPAILRPLRPISELDTSVLCSELGSIIWLPLVTSQDLADIGSTVKQAAERLSRLKRSTPCCSLSPETNGGTVIKRKKSSSSTMSTCSTSSSVDLLNIGVMRTPSLERAKDHQEKSDRDSSLSPPNTPLKKYGMMSQREMLSEEDSQ